jgi:hypothetical protein
MSSKSDYLENNVINHFLRNGSVTSPTTVYVALYTVDPSDAGGGTEVSGGSYAREAVTFSIPSGGATSNSSLITFTTATASWGTITAFGIFDQLSGGNLLYWGQITDKLIDNGDTATFAASSISITEL